MRLRAKRLTGAASVGVLAAIVLTGCVASQPPEFGRDQTDEDRLPSSIDGDPMVDLESTRYAGTAGDHKIYIGRSSVDGGVCGVAVRADTDVWATSACSSVGVGMTLENGTQIEVGAFRFPGEGERVQLSDSVTVLK